MKQIKITCRDRLSDRSVVQVLNFSDGAAEALAKEISIYDNEKIKVGTSLYYLLTGCMFLTKAEGFELTPDFDLELPDWIDEVNGVYKA